MSDPAPGRYCLKVCYCGECDHYVPMTQRWRGDEMWQPGPQDPPRRRGVDPKYRRRIQD